jgi:hypothetical protein
MQGYMYYRYTVYQVNIRTEQITQIQATVKITSFGGQVKQYSAAQPLNIEK